MKDKVLEVSIKLLLHMSAFYALFIHFHGEESAGGGFQAGAIIASVFLVYQMIFDDEDYVVSESLSNKLLFSGLMFYFGFGVLTLLLGGSFLDFYVLEKFGLSEATSQKLGIFIIELGVLIVVGAGLLKMGYAFKRIFDKIKTDSNQ